jgi:hypothetical protein
MPPIRKTLAGSHRVGLSDAGDLLVTNPTTGVNEYVPRSTTIKRIVQLTQAAYNALTPDAATMYVIIG